MEFFDEESRPRFILQSHSPNPKSNPQTDDHFHKPTLFISLSLSALFLTLSLFYFHSDPLQSIFIWFSLSLLLGPFAPSSLTAGDIRVGLGPPLPNQPPPTTQKTSKLIYPKKPTPLINQPSLVAVNNNNNNNKTTKPVVSIDVKEAETETETDWSVGDFEMLKKLMLKYPVGMPGRWEAVAEGFGGRHKVESVVKMVKAMGDRKLDDSDSFSRFLKDRKAVDKRVDEVIERERLDGSWSCGEDIGLLNALKAFPKDVGMRWEKISAAVPGRSKAACMKRVAELKKDFRSSKASSSVN